MIHPRTEVIGQTAAPKLGMGNVSRKVETLRKDSKGNAGNKKNTVTEMKNGLINRLKVDRSDSQIYIKNTWR